MNAQGILFASSTAMLIAAGGFQFAPLQGFADNSDPALTERTGFSSSFSAFAERFDLSRLPEPKAQEPIAAAVPPAPPDPAASLKQYKFIGLARSDNRSAGVFERGGAASVVARGASLEGFSLQEVSADGARFVNKEIEAMLPLQAPQSR